MDAFDPLEIKVCWAPTGIPSLYRWPADVTWKCLLELCNVLCQPLFGGSINYATGRFRGTDRSKGWLYSFVFARDVADLLYNKWKVYNFAGYLISQHSLSTYRISEYTAVVFLLLLWLIDWFKMTQLPQVLFMFMSKCEYTFVFPILWTKYLNKRM
jgi:hypothetical protein